MQSGWRIGSLFGIPLFINPSWFFILILVSTINALDFATKWGLTLGASAGLVMALLLFGSVLLHELGHSLVARSQGIPVNSITLFLFGGVAAIDRESKTPGEAFQVAIAGPMVSIGISAFLRLLALAISQPVLLHDMLVYLSTINLVLALFNLIPGLPLDGGQVLKSAIWKVTGSRFQGVRWAARTGQALGILAIIGGIVLDVLTQDLFSGFWIALLGVFCIRNALTYNRVANLQETLLNLTAQDAMSRDFRVVDAQMTIAQFAQVYLQENAPDSLYFAASDGRYRGRISLEDLRYIERSQWETQTVDTITQSLSVLISVQEKTPLSEVINELEAHHLNRLVVLTPTGAPAGILDRGDIVRVVAEKLNFPLSEIQLQQVKEEGTYPPNLQLSAIARSTVAENH